MVTFRTVSSLGFAPSVMLCAILFVGVASAQITVEPRVQVSKANGNRAHFEVLLAADPENPNHLLGCSIIEANQPSAQEWHTVVYSSMDGGVSWQPTLEVDRGVFGSGDPACTFGIDNRAYFVTLLMGTGFPGSTEDSRMAVYRSLDAGRTWEPPVDLPYLDREFIAVDTTQSKYRGHVYINGNGSVRAVREGDALPLKGSTYFRSLDGGRTFSYPYLVASSPSHHPPGQTQSSILSDGTVAAAYMDFDGSERIDLTNRVTTANAAIHVVTSSDGEETFSRAVVAQEVHSCNGVIPSLASDRSGGPFHDHLYLTWTDLRSGRCEILLSESSDKGKNWSQPIVVNDDLPNGPNEERVDPNHIMSVVAVNKEGVVGVMWYDPRDGRDKFGYSVRFSASLDGGETFLPSIRVSEVPGSYEIKDWQFWMQAEGGGGGHSDPYVEGGNFKGSLGVNMWPGHTTGMAASADGAFHPFWVDNRTGLTQVWTATVKVQGQAFVNGTSELANWQDLTPRLALQFANPKFDPLKKLATIDIYLVNTSKDSIRGPFKLRFVSMQSEMGEVKLMESANSSQRAGAIVNVDREIPNGKLEPGERTSAIRLQFGVTDPRLRTSKPEIVKFEAKVLGKRGESGSKSDSQ